MKELNDIEWVKIPKGDFRRGISQERSIEMSELYGSKVFLLEPLEERVFVPEFEIMKYPVTNSLFQSFVDATKYQSNFWMNYTNGKDEHPVRFVSYYDALMFCFWIKARLPTAVEWEKAASGEDGLTYPWGNNWNALNCNSGEIDSDSEFRYKSAILTTPVDMFPQGVSPYGVWDMAGNVAELTATMMITNFDTDVLDSYNRVGRSEWLQSNVAIGTDRAYDLSPVLLAERPVLKGGNCTSNRLGLRCGTLFTKYLPNSRGDFVGFRCVKL